ncbi:MAG: isocitrate/isopropylmalate dehydrogenase family protein, partial [Planctomycetota bacterium]
MQSNLKPPYTITLIPGDGIGPEITEAVVKVVDATGCGLRWEPVVAGLEALEEHGELMPKEVHRSLQRNKIALKGPLTTPVGTGHKSLNVQLRQKYQLYANIRPIALIPGIDSRYVGEAMNMVIFRESTEGLYTGIEHTIVPGVVETLKIITEKASTRIASKAFQYARHRGRQKVTAVHKANIMKQSDGLFLECCRKIAKKHPEIAYEELIVDNCSMQMVMNPSQFDVILLPNLYGDIMSDLCAGLVGGLGVTPGANIGDKHAVFEAVHGSAPDIAGQGIANPTAMLLSAAMMLRHLNMDDSAFLIRTAVGNVISRGKSLTRDLGGEATTEEYTAALIKEVQRLAKRGP